MIAHETKNRAKAVGAALRHPTSWLLLGMGFSAGLPFLLVGGTLSFWLRQTGISLTLIGFITSVSIIYGAKVLWSPWMDKVRLPLLYRWLGQRRSYMMLSQIGVGAGLCLMAVFGPQNLTAFICTALFVAFAAASQEIAIDAWRVEQTESEADQALNPSFYAFGFRIAILTTDALVLVLSKRVGWPLSYQILALAMLIGIAVTLLAPRSAIETHIKTSTKTLYALIIEPFVSFFNAHKGTAGLILLTLALYRLPDYLTNIAGAMYVDTSLDPDTIAAMRASVGLAASFIGIAMGGSCLLFLGVRRTFLLGALIGPLSNIGFSWMSVSHGDPLVFGIALVADNLSNGIAETAFVGFMTQQVMNNSQGREHTLTHYALMYSVAALTGKILKGFTGLAVDQMTPELGLFNAYSAFFMGTALIGLPCLILCWYMGKKGVFSR
jgi:PAT family beta-lactamase induction signal transducer AmpG